MIRYPYSGNRNASIELIASTEMHGDMFTADQMPVLSARVSHGDSGKTGAVRENDIKLMNFLAENRHMTPFEHQSATFRVKAPIFVFREWHRHRTQAFNEISMRYCSDPVGTFFKPITWRQQASRDKQSSAGNLQLELSAKAYAILNKANEDALVAYNALLDLGVCREQARTVVPVGNYTEMYATANLRNWFGFWLLRSDEHAQLEIRLFSDAIDEMLSELYPDSWQALKESVNET